LVCRRGGVPGTGDALDVAVPVADHLCSSGDGTNAGVVLALGLHAGRSVDGMV
jgi:hypothetical protein